MKIWLKSSVLAVFFLAVVATSQDSASRTKPGGPAQAPSSAPAARVVSEARSPLRTLGGGDTCATAFAIPSLPFNDTGNTTGAANDVNDVSCPHPLLSSPTDPGPDLIYSFTVTAGNSVTITVGNTDPYDTSIYLLSTCGNPTSCVAYSDTVPGNPAETIGPVSLASGTYYLYIDSFYSADPSNPRFNAARAQGPYTLSMTGNFGNTPTPTFSNTPTNTQTSTPTSTPSPPFTPTPTITPTFTPTPTLVPTFTPTRTPTASFLNFYTLTPCRVIDTRGPAGPYGAPALAAGASRTFVFAGQCGIPSGAVAVAINVIAINPSTNGFLTLFPTGSPFPPTSTINYRTGIVRANNAIIPLGALGAMDVVCGQAFGNVNAVVDVSGYFAP